MQSETRKFHKSSNFWCESSLSEGTLSNHIKHTTEEKQLKTGNKNICHWHALTKTNPTGTS